MTQHTIAATPISPAASSTHRPDNDRSMTLVNLSSHVLRLARIEGADKADGVPRQGVLVRRGHQLHFSVARSPERRVVAYLEIDDDSKPDGGQQYPVTIAAPQSARSTRATSTPSGAIGPRLTQLHLTQDDIVLRDAAT